MLISCAIGIPSAILLVMWACELKQERDRAKLMQEYYELKRKWYELQDKKNQD